MELFRKWVVAPWREMPSWASAVTLVVVIAGASVLDHVIGGKAGFFIALVLALVVVVLIPLVWGSSQR